MTNRKKTAWFWKFSILPAASLALALLAAGLAMAADEVIATLDGRPIHLSEVERNSAFQIWRLRSSIYSLLEREARGIADARLLSAEAARRGMSVDALLKEEVDGKVPPVTEKDVENYLAANPADATKGAEARDRLKVYLSRQALIQRRLDYTASLRAKADYRFLLSVPERPRIDVATEGAPSRGGAQAPVVLVHFAYFPSALCAASAEKIRRILEEFPGQVRWVHRDFFSIQETVALYAAEMGRAAFEQGTFWEYHDRLMALKGRVTREAVDGAAASFGIDRKRFGADQKEGRHLLRVKEDIDYGVRIGIQAAPVIFVNGAYFSGTFSYDELKRLVERELKK